MEQSTHLLHGSFSRLNVLTHTAQLLVSSSESLKMACWYSLGNCHFKWKALGERPILNLFRTAHLGQ